MWNLWHWDVSQMWNPSTEFLSDSYNSPLPISYCHHLFLIPTAQIKWGQTKWVCADTVWLLWQVTRRIFLTWSTWSSGDLCSKARGVGTAVSCGSDITKLIPSHWCAERNPILSPEASGKRKHTINNADSSKRGCLYKALSLKESLTKLMVNLPDVLSL